MIFENCNENTNYTRKLKSKFFQKIYQACYGQNGHAQPIRGQGRYISCPSRLEGIRACQEKGTPSDEQP